MRVNSSGVPSSYLYSVVAAAATPVGPDVAALTSERSPGRIGEHTTDGLSDEAGLAVGSKRLVPGQEITPLLSAQRRRHSQGQRRQG